MENLLAAIWNRTGAPAIGILGGALFLGVVVIVIDHLLR
jgi:hypothetical protein